VDSGDTAWIDSMATPKSGISAGAKASHVR
jgi:hypothetical protein